MRLLKVRGGVLEGEQRVESDLFEGRN